MRRFWPWALGVLCLAVLCGVFYWLHPLAPLLLVGSLLIQAPIALGMARRGGGKSYAQRAAARRVQWLQNQDAAAWLAAEEKEAAGRGFLVWSRGARALNHLARAEALCALGRKYDAAELLAALEPDALPPALRLRYADAAEAVAKAQAAP